MRMEKNSHILTKEEFIKLIEDHMNQQSRIDALQDVGIDVYDSPLIEYGNFLFERIFSIYFSEEGREWIYWWLYEKNGNPEMKAWDKDNNEIPTETIEDLWNIVEEYLR